MDIAEWWPKLKSSTREWLVENNGDAVPAEIVIEITAAGGVIVSDAWWVATDAGPSGFHLSDKAIDWIEAIANDETPEDL